MPSSSLWDGVEAAVCVPAFGRPEGLAELADALAHQDLNPRKWALVVAIDGPQPALEAVARAEAHVVVTLDTNQGSYAARNAAIDAVPDTVPFLVFTDIDCRPVPGWLSHHVELLRAGASLTGGAVAIDVSSRPTAAEYVDATRFLQQEYLVKSAGFAATCNLGARTEVLRELRFDARLRSGGDREFGLRARQAGHPTVYAPLAIVHHDARRRARDVFRKTKRTATGTRRIAELGLAGPLGGARAPRPSGAEWLHSRELRPPALWSLRTWSMGTAVSVTWALWSGQLPWTRR